jgi:hypothetical protein
MNYQTISTESLKKELKQLQSYLRWSRMLVSVEGGWMMWDSEKEARVEKQVYDIEAELRRRETEKTWI